MEVAKLAYHQVEIMEEEQENGKGDEEPSGEEEDEDVTNSRDVGHNIYILAHQVFCFTKASPVN